MKEKIYNFTLTLLCFLSLIFIFVNNKDVASIILAGVNLFFERIFVSLFPMFIINDLLISCNIPYYFYQVFNTLFKKLFKTSGISAYVLIMSLISGTPSNAYILKNLKEENILSKEEANHYLRFTYFSNPLFLSTMLSLMFSPKVCIKIILCHYISNLLIALITRNKAPEFRETKIKKVNITLGSALINSIKKSINTLLMILGTVVFYSIVVFIINNILPLNITFKTLISGLIEITNGLNALTLLSMSLNMKEIIAVSIISFGGLSIHTQIKSILEDTDLDYIYFLKGRLMQTIISVILVILF